MNKKILPYGRQCVGADDVRAVVRTLKSDRLTQGPKVLEFEEAFAKYCGAPYAVAVSSGTAGLHLAALVVGFRQAEEAVTTPITFVASSNCLIYAGAKPVFADIDPLTVGLDSVCVKKVMSTKTRAIVNVHFAGQPSMIGRKETYSRRRDFYVIEDACHALGASYLAGDSWKKIGSCYESDMAVFSFHPVKSITTGEGGMITTRSRDLYERLRLLRSHGITKDSKFLLDKKKAHQPWYYEMQELGFNYRISDIQCALGISQLKKLNLFIKTRCEIANFYDQRFERISTLRIPARIPGTRSSHHLYVLRVDFKKIGTTREEVMRRLSKKGIVTQVHYIPVTHQPYYKKRFRPSKEMFPVAERYYETALSIPIYPAMTKAQTRHVVSSVEQICCKG